MTVEIRELVIQARVTTGDACGTKPAGSATPVDLASERIREERLIQTITRKVIEQLRDREWSDK